MRLVLKNFRCHIDSKISIPDNGLVLLSGPSGKGKTTVLNAIVYALYGSVRKPYSFGTNTCSVELDTINRDDVMHNPTSLPEIYIKRSSRPNTLIVRYHDEEYVDDAAQSVIDSIFLSRSLFELSCYILQGSENSLLTLPPAEQLSMIESLASVDTDNCTSSSPEEMRAKVKDAIKNNEKVKNQIIGKMDALEQMTMDFEKCCKSFKKPKNTKEQINSTIQTLDSTIKEKTSLVKSLRTKRDEAILLEKNRAVATKAISVCNDQLEALLVNLQEVQKNTPKYSTEDAIQNAEREMSRIKKEIKDLSTTLKYAQLSTLIDEYERSVSSDGIDSNETIAIISSVSRRIFPDVEEIKSELSRFNTIVKGIKECRSSLLKLYSRWIQDSNVPRFESIKEFHRYITSTTISDPMSCPCCNAELVVVESTLMPFVKLDSTTMSSVGDSQTLCESVCESQRDSQSLCNSSDRYKDYLSVLDKTTFEYGRLIKEYESIDIKRYIKDIEKILKSFHIGIKTLDNDRFPTESDNIKLFNQYYKSKRDNETDILDIDTVRSLPLSLDGLYDNNPDSTLQENVLYENGIESKFDSMHLWISIILSSIDALLELSKNMSRMLNVLESSKGVVKVPDYIKKAKKDIDDIVISEALKKDIDVSVCEQKKKELEIALQELSETIPKCWSWLSNINNIETSIKKQKQSMDSIASKTPSESLIKKNLDVSSIDSEIQTIELDIEDLRSSITENQKELQIINEYSSMLKAKEDNDARKEQLQLAKEQLKSIERKEINLSTLESSFKEAQLLAIEYTLSSINSAMRHYLDEFFEDPILLNLKIEMESKRPKIVTTIDYKGNEYSSINELSGGERQRCHLAAILALYDLAGGKILLLDESLNSLDSDVNTNTLLIIKDVESMGLVIVVSHEAVEGVFDEIVKI